MFVFVSIITSPTINNIYISPFVLSISVFITHHHWDHAGGNIELVGKDDTIIGKTVMCGGQKVGIKDPSDTTIHMPIHSHTYPNMTQ